MSLNRAALLAEVTTNLPDNTTGAITPAIVRTTLSDILNNIWTLQDPNTAVGDPVTFTSIALGITGLLYGNGAAKVTALAPGQIPGSAANDSASAGNIGEFITATTTGVALTSGAALTITSIALTAGDWDVWGDVVFLPAGTTTIQGFATASNTVTNTFPSTTTGGGLNKIFAPLTTGNSQALPVGCERYSFAGTTTVYLVALAFFGVSTMAADGKLSARRAR